MESDPLNTVKKPTLYDTFILLHTDDKEFNITLIMEFFLKCSFNFLAYLLSIFYIEVWELDSFTAGILVAANSCQILFIPILGGVVDYIGVKDGYILVSLLGISVFLLLALIENLILHALLIIVGVAAISVLTFSSLKSAVRLSTNLQTRSLGFSIFNSVLYMSTIFFGLFSELVFSLQGITMDAFRTIFFVITGFYICALLVSIFFSKLNKPWRKNSTQSSKPTPLAIVKEVIKEKRFWKCATVLTIGAIPVGTLYQSGFVFPIYLDREIEGESYYGIIIACFSVLIIVLSPLLTPIVYYLSLYDCLILGGLLIGIAPTFFVFGCNFYTIAPYILITAIGGAIFECRVVDYNAMVATPGKEGIYLTLICLTYSFAYFVTGIIGGKLLEEFCPEDGESDCWIMWWGIGLVSILGSIVLIIFKSCLEQVNPQEEINDYDETSHLN